MKTLITAALAAATLGSAASAATTTVVTADPTIGFYDVQTNYATNCEFDPNKISEYENLFNDYLSFLFNEDFGLYVIDYDYDDTSFYMKIKSSTNPTVNMVMGCNP